MSRLVVAAVVVGCGGRATPSDGFKLVVDDRPCTQLSMLLDGDGMWIAVSPTMGCFAPRKGGALDFDWLDAELRGLRRADCSQAIEVAARASAVKYDEVIHVMDVAAKA